VNTQLSYRKFNRNEVRNTKNGGSVMRTKRLVVTIIAAICIAAIGAAPLNAQSSDAYVVRPGDTMLKIAARYEVSVSQLAEANGLHWNSWVYVGQRLVIPGYQPGPDAVYVVQWGDTLSGIARRFDTTIKSIMSTNGLTSIRIWAGQRLTIPGPQPSPSFVYVVQWGDTLGGIGYRFGVDVKSIMSTNGLTSSRIFAGQSLTIPGCAGGAFCAP